MLHKQFLTPALRKDRPAANFFSVACLIVEKGSTCNYPWAAGLTIVRACPMENETLWAPGPLDIGSLELFPPAHSIFTMCHYI